MGQPGPRKPRLQQPANRSGPGGQFAASPVGDDSAVSSSLARSADAAGRDSGHSSPVPERRKNPVYRFIQFFSGRDAERSSYAPDRFLASAVQPALPGDRAWRSFLVLRQRNK